MPLLFSPVYSPICLLQLQSFLIRVHMEMCPPHSPVKVKLSIWQPLLQTFPSPRLLGRGRHSCLLWPAYLQFMWGSAPPPPPELRTPHPLCYMSFFFQLLVFYSGFFLFSLGRVQSVQGGMLICPREYCMLLICSPGGLHLPSSLGAGIWWCGSPPGFSI
jgi:hypothetical protein